MGDIVISVGAGDPYRLEQAAIDLPAFTDIDFSGGGEIEIRRGADGLYWNGATWQVAQVWNATTVAGGGAFHYYDFTIPAGADNGASFIVMMRALNDDTTEDIMHLIAAAVSAASSSVDGEVF